MRAERTLHGHLSVLLSNPRSEGRPTRVEAAVGVTSGRVSRGKPYPVPIDRRPSFDGARGGKERSHGDQTMRAVAWQGIGDVRVDVVPDPVIEEPTDAIVRITSSAICGSDLHLYSVLPMFMERGDILGHEPMGIVEEVGADVEHIRPGDRVVVPFNISCGHCFMCSQKLSDQCETTQ